MLGTAFKTYSDHSGLPVALIDMIFRTLKAQPNIHNPLPPTYGSLRVQPLVANKR